MNTLFFPAKCTKSDLRFFMLRRFVALFWFLPSLSSCVQADMQGKEWMAPVIKAKQGFYVLSSQSVTDQCFTATHVQWKWNIKVHKTHSVVFS